MNPRSPWSSAGLAPTSTTLGVLTRRGQGPFRPAGGPRVVDGTDGLDPAGPRYVGGFSGGQRQYLAFHQNGVFLQTSFKY
jgi:hypothetical protein